jgi:hypothetical protein
MYGLQITCSSMYRKQVTCSFMPQKLNAYQYLNGVETAGNNMTRSFWRLITRVVNCNECLIDKWYLYRMYDFIVCPEVWPIIQSFSSFYQHLLTSRKLWNFISTKECPVKECPVILLISIFSGCFSLFLMWKRGKRGVGMY